MSEAYDDQTVCFESIQLFPVANGTDDVWNCGRCKRTFRILEAKQFKGIGQRWMLGNKVQGIKPWYLKCTKIEVAKQNE